MHAAWWRAAAARGGVAVPGPVHVALPSSRPLLIASMYGEGDPGKWAAAPWAAGFDAVRVTDIIEGSLDDLAGDPQGKWGEVRAKRDVYREAGLGWVLDLSYVRNRMSDAHLDPYAPAQRGVWAREFARAADVCAGYPPVYVSLAGEVLPADGTDRLAGFWAWAAAEWHAFSSVPVCAGGMLHYDDGGAHKWSPAASIEAGMDLAAVHVYSDKDIESLRATVARVHALGAPCLVEEMGVRRVQADRVGAGRRMLRACLDAGADGIGLWGLCGDPDGEYALAPGRDDGVLALVDEIRRTGTLRGA